MFGRCLNCWCNNSNRESLALACPRSPYSCRPLSNVLREESTLAAALTVVLSVRLSPCCRMRKKQTMFLPRHRSRLFEFCERGPQCPHCYCSPLHSCHAVFWHPRSALGKEEFYILCVKRTGFPTFTTAESSNVPQRRFVHLNLMNFRAPEHLVPLVCLFEVSLASPKKEA